MLGSDALRVMVDMTINDFLLSKSKLCKLEFFTGALNEAASLLTNRSKSMFFVGLLI